MTQDAPSPEMRRATGTREAARIVSRMVAYPGTFEDNMGDLEAVQSARPKVVASISVATRKWVAAFFAPGPCPLLRNAQAPAQRSAGAAVRAKAPHPVDQKSSTAREGPDRSAGLGGGLAAVDGQTDAPVSGPFISAPDSTA